MHNAAFAALGLNWRYLAFDVYPEQLEAALIGARRMNFVGVNLTVPHKLLALEMMDVLDEGRCATVFLGFGGHPASFTLPFDSVER